MCKHARWQPIDRQDRGRCNWVGECRAGGARCCESRMRRWPRRSASSGPYESPPTRGAWTARWTAAEGDRSEQRAASGWRLVVVIAGHARCDRSVAAGGPAEVVECGASAGKEVPVGEAADTPSGAGGRCKLAAAQGVQRAELRQRACRSAAMRRARRLQRPAARAEVQVWGELVLVLRCAERFQRLVGSDELWLNLCPMAGAMRSRTTRCGRCGSCSWPALSHFQERAPGRSLREMAGANGSTTEARGSAEETRAPKLSCAGWRSARLASAAQELKEAVSAGGAPE